MTDRDAGPIDPADGEALSAWLDGELDPAEAEALERRLATEPALARRLDVLHDALVALRGLDAADPPEDFDARLAERLRSDPGAEVVPLDRQPRRARPEAGARRAPWGWLGAAAAALVLLAGALSVPLLFGGGGGGGTGAGDRTAEDTAGEETESEAAQEAASADAAVARPSAPVIVEEAVAFAGSVPAPESAGPTPAPPLPASPSDTGGGAAVELGERFLTVPEAVGLLGISVEEARGIAEEFSAVIQDAPAFSSGVRPGACLATVTQPAPDRPGAVLVPARVEAFSFEGSPALAYVLVGASTDAPTLDRLELWVTDPVTCDTRIFVSR